MPELLIGDYYITCLHSAGTVEYAGMGHMVALSWTELKDWNEATERGLSGWDLEVIRALSSAYASQSEKSKKPSCLRPSEENGVSDKKRVSDDIKRVFSALAKKE